MMETEKAVSSAVVVSADTYFGVLLDAIRQARQSISLATYLFTHDLREPDCRGRQISQALCLAAARGLAVSVVLGRSQSPRLNSLNTAVGRLLVRGGVKAFIQQPEGLALHDKFAVFDPERDDGAPQGIADAVVTVGGPNITHTGLSNRCDLVTVMRDKEQCAVLVRRFANLTRKAEAITP